MTERVRPHRGGKMVVTSVVTQEGMRAEARRGERYINKDPRISHDDAKKYDSLRGTNGRSVLGEITSRTGLSFPRIHDQYGEPLGGDVLRRHAGPFQLEKSHENLRWHAMVLDPRRNEEGEPDQTFRMQLEPKTHERHPNPADIVTISLGENLEIRRGEEVLYDDRLSYEGNRYEQMRIAVAASLAPREDELQARHNAFIARLQQSQ